MMEKMDELGKSMGLWDMMENIMEKSLGLWEIMEQVWKTYGKHGEKS